MNKIYVIKSHSDHPKTTSSWDVWYSSKVERWSSHKKMAKLFTREEAEEVIRDLPTKGAPETIEKLPIEERRKPEALIHENFREEAQPTPIKGQCPNCGEEKTINNFNSMRCGNCGGIQEIWKYLTRIQENYQLVWLRK
tara:strand:- start:18799 stop:19215 length:417 start_codon:yes stop_codon:yes gene_type:complete